MNIYEFITPSDPITFLAANDKIATYVAITLGNGKAGCHRLKPLARGEGGNLNTIWMFHSDPIPEIDKILGESFNNFIENHRQEVADAFKSFAYGSVADREQYDAAVAAITDPEKLKEFQAKHDDLRRSSMSQWVKEAWRIGNALCEPEKTQTQS